MWEKYAWLRVAILVSTIVCVSLGSYYCYWAEFNSKLTTVTEGKVYRSAAMSPEKLKKTIQQLGINTVIDLRKSGRQSEIDQEHRVVESLGSNHINLPACQVPADATIKKYLEILDDPSSYPVLIHCHHGEGRAVLFSAVYRIEYEGWENHRARKASRLIIWRSAFSADAKKGEYLDGYQSMDDLGTSKTGKRLIHGK